MKTTENYTLKWWILWYVNSVSISNAEDLDSIPGLGRSSGGGHGNPLQYSCQENPDGQRNPWGRKESDMTKQLSTAQQINGWPVRERYSCICGRVMGEGRWGLIPALKLHSKNRPMRNPRVQLVGRRQRRVLERKGEFPPAREEGTFANQLYVSKPLGQNGTSSEMN